MSRSGADHPGILAGRTGDACVRIPPGRLRNPIVVLEQLLFYCTQHGVTVGDMFTSLIHTAELHSKNPFDYLTALLRHARAVAQQPEAWMPWNYEATLTAFAPAT